MKQETNNRVLCTNCILPSTFPGISFDETGVCNHCRQYKGVDITNAQQNKYEKKFTNLLNEVERVGTYDVIVAYSGGKDSTYTLDILVNRYNLNALAVTLDNSFVSPRALENIGAVCDNLGVDSMIIKPNKKMLRSIFGKAAEQELYSA